MSRFITRKNWDFEGPLGPAKVALPVRGAWLHHSVTTPTSNPLADMRTLERIGKERFGRLSYSYAVHYHPSSPVATVLEGQGDWIGAHTAKQNSTSLGIVLIGNFEANRVPAPMVEALVELVRELHDGGVMNGYLLGGHRDAPNASTSCPGRYAHPLVRTVNQLAKQPPTVDPRKEADPLPHLSEDDQKWLAEFVAQARRSVPEARPSSLWYLLDKYRLDREYFRKEAP